MQSNMMIIHSFKHKLKLSNCLIELTNKLNTIGFLNKFNIK